MAKTWKKNIYAPVWEKLPSSFQQFPETLIADIDAMAWHSILGLKLHPILYLLYCTCSTDRQTLAVDLSNGYPDNLQPR